REISGEEITAKDFRTWAATNLAVVALRELAAGTGGTVVKQHVVRAIEAVAQMLGNTPAICRKCYIHPAIFEGYLDGSLLAALANPRNGSGDDLAGLKPDETAVTAFLCERLARGIGGPVGSAGQPTSTVGVKI